MHGRLANKYIQTCIQRFETHWMQDFGITNDHVAQQHIVKMGRDTLATTNWFVDPLVARFGNVGLLKLAVRFVWGSWLVGGLVT